MRQSIILIGAGGHSKSVIAALKADHYSAADIFVCADPTPVTDTFEGCCVVPHTLSESRQENIFIAIGDNSARSRIYERLCKNGSGIATIIHPYSCQTMRNLPNGTFLGARSYIGPSAFVGDGCIVNTAAVLEHDATLENFAHLAPGSVVGGHARICERTFIGMGAIVRDCIHIGKDCVIGMGSVVTRDVPDNCQGWGNPFRIHRRA